MQSNVESQVGLFSQVVNNDEQFRLVTKLTDIFDKELTWEDIIVKLRSWLPADCLVYKAVYESYEIFRTLRTGLVRRNLEVPENHPTVSLISRRIISVIWDGKEKVTAIRLYDQLRQELNWERRSEAGYWLDISDSI